MTIDFKDMIFIKEPEERPLENYNEVILRAVDNFSDLPGLVAIYQIGGVGAPGISDLDILLIFEDEAPPISRCWSKGFRESDLYLFLHPPLAVNVSLLRNSQLFAVLNNMKLLWGDDLFIKRISSGLATDFFKRLLCAEYVLRLLATGIRQLLLNVVRVRPSLCELHSLNYDLSLLSDFGHKDKAKFQNIISWLRDEWFNLKLTVRHQTIVEALRLGVVIELDILSHLGFWADSQFSDPLSQLPVLSRRVPTVWPRISIVTKNDINPRSILQSNFILKNSLICLFPWRRVREAFWHIQSIDIPVSPTLLHILAGQSAKLSEDVKQALKTRQQLAKNYCCFMSRIGGNFGRFWRGPLEVPYAL